MRVEESNFHNARIPEGSTRSLKSFHATCLALPGSGMDEQHSFNPGYFLAIFIF
jgi:hypothetical protein